MEIRRYEKRDLSQIIDLFYETVHTVNRKDYSQEQVNTWASSDERGSKFNTWGDSLAQNTTFVALDDRRIVGFSDLSSRGLIDRLYIHHEYQRIGIASALLNEIELAAHRIKLKKLRTEASITAKPFFERKGFQVITKQIINKNGITMPNYLMVKTLQ
ncbi:GNAT family N-acetyltransferase [Pseudalkalibacillus hwajinpoensis]|uniref:GNAT family N-acetyltransferase n=1 Tax=Guptibacillus hwajinpoensis TaxID=208199 RepID=A0A4U1MLE8_9BACL|nr:GNAT family N-acetyltransferase [Pseudalkalibacillus hwajinpoensis]TKD71362.1 GNAT family N-acetyltransferase [Pseudalkalibacillus hwajinpoensis]